MCLRYKVGASLCVGPRLEMYTIASLDAGDVLAGLTSAVAPRVLALLRNPESDISSIFRALPEASGANCSVNRMPLAIT